MKLTNVLGQYAVSLEERYEKEDSPQYILRCTLNPKNGYHTISLGEKGSTAQLFQSYSEWDSESHWVRCQNMLIGFGYKLVEKATQYNSGGQ